MNVAVYGGSFDPVHLGHVMVVSHLLLNDPTVDQVLVTVCYRQKGKKLIPFEDRMHMARTAFGWLPRTLVSNVEALLGGESYTLRTMQHLKAEHPEWNLRFVMGAELLETAPSWKGWDELKAIAPPLLIGRAGYSEGRKDHPTPIAPLVSSTVIREALARGDYTEAERYMPRAVLAYIQTNKLYLAKPAHGS